MMMMVINLVDFYQFHYYYLKTTTFSSPEARIVWTRGEWYYIVLENQQVVGA